MTNGKQMYGDFYNSKQANDVFLEKSIRSDGRKLLEFREINIQSSSISTCYGSSTVKLGNTLVLAGIKGEIAIPHATTPNAGFIVPNVDLPAFCSPMFKPGVPSELAQTTSQLLYKNISLDLDALVIEKGKAVWVLYMDVVCLNYDGNLLDASLLAIKVNLLMFII
jgi:exosome complex component RRP43